jgi:hypothetical protein
MIPNPACYIYNFTLDTDVTIQRTTYNLQRKIELSKISLFTIFQVFVLFTFAQREAKEEVSPRQLKNIEKAVGKQLRGLSKEEAKATGKLQQAHTKLLQTLTIVDSAFAGDVTALYQDRLLQMHAKKGSYLARIDSIRNMIAFLQEGQMDEALRERLDALGDMAGEVKEKLAIANSWQNLADEQLRHVQDWLATPLQEINGLVEPLKHYQQQLHTYKQQLQAWKDIWQQPGRAEQLALQALNKVPGFQEFIKQHALLGALGGGGNNGAPAAPVAGVQSRQGVMQELMDRFSQGDANGTQTMMPQKVQEQLGDAMGQLQDLKQQVEGIGSQVENGAMGNKALSLAEQERADLKALPFAKRLQLKYNLQTGGGLRQFPAINDVGWQVGYLLAPRLETGIGGAYKFALGESLRKLEWSSQGLALRSYFDWRVTPANGKLFKGFWLTAAFEMNYWNTHAMPDTALGIQPRSIGWTEAGLAGITKKIGNGKKEMQVQLLWQFVQDRQVQSASPFLFRWGRSF